MDQGPPHKAGYTETYRGQSGEEPQAHWFKGKFPQQNTNGLGSKIKNQQMRPQKNCKASVRQRKLSIGQNVNQQIGKRCLPILLLRES